MLKRPGFPKSSEIFIRFILIIIGIEMGIRLSEFTYYFYFEKMAIRKSVSDASSYRIACIGESTVMGYGSEEGGDFPAQLQNLLTANFSNSKIKVYNLGVGGISAKRIYNNLGYIFNYYDPHLVILCAGNNLLEMPYIFQKSRNEGINKIIIFINNLKTVRLLRFFKVSIKKYFIGDRTPMFHVRHSFPKSYSRDIPAVIVYQHDNKLIEEQTKGWKYKVVELESKIWLDKIIKKSMVRKFKFIICNYFYSWVNDYLKDEARKYNIYFVDNEKIYEEYLRSGKEGEILSDDKWHPNAKGYGLMAENIYGTLMDNKLIGEQD